MINVVVVDGHSILRYGLVSLLADHPEFNVIGQASTTEEAVFLTGELQPDVVTIDEKMPGIDGISATEKIRQVLPEVKILVLASAETGKELFTALNPGALGYILKNVPLNEMIYAIKTVAKGETVISPSIAVRLLDGYRRMPDYEHIEEYDLSPREAEVLKLVSIGASNKHIALKLFVAESTVKAHLRKILHKLRASNRTEAIAIAYAKSLIS